jgi:Tfp pilus assembly protein FimT
MRRLSGAVRPAQTLLELSLVLAIIGLASIIAGHELKLHLDRLAVRNAIAEAAGVLARARDEALAQGTVVSVRVDTVAATLALDSRGETLARHALGHAHGVTLSASRDSIAFDRRGVGYGATSVRFAARRGSAADTLVVSRLGRVRY